MIQHKIRLCGSQCIVEEFGDPDGPAIVFLHGWLDNLASFQTLIPYFKSFRVFALDFPGHGLSEHLPSGMAYHFLDLVYVIQDLVQHFQLSEIHLVGHSMGGAAATLFASVSSCVKTLILLEALGPLTVTAEDTFKLMQNSIRDRSGLVNKRKSVYPRLQDAIDLRAEHSKIEAEIIAPIVKRGVEQVANGFQWRSDSRLMIASINRLTEQQLKPLIEQINCPVLLIEAKQGLFSNNQVVQARKTHFKKLQVEVLSGGHHLHMEHPESTAGLIIAFIEQANGEED